MRLIDIVAFRKEHRMNEYCEDCERNARECQYNDFSMMDFCGWLDDAPTVEAAPVKHGRWVGDETCEAYDICGVKTWAVKRRCSACGFTHKFIEAHMYYDFCPKCSAKMDLEELDDHNGTD